LEENNNINNNINEKDKNNQKNGEDIDNISKVNKNRNVKQKRKKQEWI